MPLDLGNGKTFSDEEVRKALADPTFDPNKFAQQNGMTDLGQIHDKLIQAQQIAGPGGYATGDQALQQQFNRYRQNTPNGRYSNDYSGWVNDQNAGALSAMRAGTYSGPATSPSDFAPGGIYNGQSFNAAQNGLGMHGFGDGWGGGTPSASPAPAQRVNTQPVQQSNAYPTINSPQSGGMFGFTQTGPNMAMASQYQSSQQPQQVQYQAAPMAEQPQTQQTGIYGTKSSAPDPKAIGNALGNWSQLGYKPSWAQ